MSKNNLTGTVNDPLIQFSDLTIDGKTYHLAWSFKGIRMAEKASGCNVLNGLKNLNEVTGEQLAGLLYGALLVDNPKCKFEDVDAIIRLDTIPLISNALVEAYINSIPKKEEAPEEPAAGSL
jgi:hypothetical protein